MWYSILRAASLAVLALVVAAGGSLAAVLALAAVFSVISAVHRPAQGALLPALARTPQQVAAANAVLSAIDNGGFLIGALLAGGVAAVASPQVAFGAAAATFVLAAFAQHRLPRDSPPPAPARERGVAARWQTARARCSHRLSSEVVVGGFAAATVVEGVTDVVIVLLALDLLHLGQPGVGYLNAAWGVGGLLGGAVAAAALVQGRLALGLTGGCVVIGCALAGIAGWPAPAPALALLALLGVGYAFVEIAETTLLQRLVPDDVLGRAFGVVESVYIAATGVGALLAPVIVGALGVRGALAACGVALAALAVCLWPVLARFEAAAPVSEREFALLRGVPFLAPLSLGTVESLALRLARVPMSAGEVIVREGDHGDRFFVIEEGEVSVSQDGRRRRLETAGEFFGEIALLRDVPRTATVVSTRAGTLLALGRDDFLSAVTGLRRSADAARAVVDERLASGPG